MPILWNENYTYLDDKFIKRNWFALLPRRY
jgi:hypothetical protein